MQLHYSSAREKKIQAAQEAKRIDLELWLILSELALLAMPAAAALILLAFCNSLPA